MIAAAAGSAPMPSEINAQHNLNSVGLTTSPAQCECATQRPSWGCMKEEK